MARAPSAPVTGKKIVQEAQLSAGAEDSEPRFPKPLAIGSKPRKNKLNDISNTIPVKPKAIKSSTPTAAKPPKKPTASRVLTAEKLVKTPRPARAEPPKPPKPRQSKQLKESKESKEAKEPKEPKDPTRIKKIVNESLKKEGAKKLQKEREMKELNDYREQRKSMLRTQNEQIRYENLKFRQQTFIPKTAWGADERKLYSSEELKLRREIEEQREKKRQERERYRSQGRARIGLDTFSNLKVSFKKPKRSSSNHTQEASQECSKPKNHNMSSFIKKKKNEIKKQQEREQLQREAEECKRINQLKILEHHNKTQLNKYKKRTNKKKPKKRPETPKIDRWEEKEFTGSRPSEDERMFEIIRDRLVYEQSGKSSAEGETPNASEEVPLFEAEEPQEEQKVIDLRLPERPAEDTDESDLESLGERHRDIKQQLLNLRNRMDQLKKATVDEQTQEAAAIKIQAHIRRFLVQRALQRYEEDYVSEDEEVQKIMQKLDSSKPKKNLEIMISDDGTPNSHPVIEEQDSQESERTYEYQDFMDVKPGTQELENQLIQDMQQVEQVKHKQQEYQKILKDQLMWQANQLNTLEQLREYDMQNIHYIAEQLDQGPELENALAEIIDRSFSHLAHAFEQNLENVASVLKRDGELEEYSEDTENTESVEGMMDALQKEGIQQKAFDDIESIHQRLQEEIDDFQDYSENERPESANSMPGGHSDFIKQIDMFWAPMGNMSFEGQEDSVGREESEHSIVGREESEHSIVGREESEHSIVDQEQSEHSIVSREESEHSIVSREESEHSIVSREESEHPMISGEESEHSIFETEPFVVDRSYATEENIPDHPDFGFLDTNRLCEHEQSEPEVPDIPQDSYRSDSQKDSPYTKEQLSSPEKIIVVDEQESPQKFLSQESPESSSPQEFESPESPSEQSESQEIPQLPIKSENQTPVSSCSSREMPQLQMFQNLEEPTIPKKIVKESPPSSQREDIQRLVPEQSGNSFTPESIPERPSAPFQELESDDDKTPTPQIISNKSYEETSETEWQLEKEVTPDMINELTEDVLKLLLQENISFETKPSHNLPPLNLRELKQEGYDDPTVSTDKGLQTDQKAVREYLNQLFSLAENSPEEVVNNLKKPLERNVLEILAKMQETEIGTPLELEIHDFPPILRVDWYLELENPSEKTSHTPNTVQLVSEAAHIHNKMMFDAANEALQRMRPYGLKGKPLPWNHDTRCFGLTFSDLPKLLNHVANQLESYAATQAGKIPTNDMVLSSGILDEELLHQVREERLANMLAEEVMMRDEIWVDYDFEETQVVLDLADMVLEHVVQETIEILNE